MKKIIFCAFALCALSFTSHATTVTLTVADSASVWDSLSIHQSLQLDSIITITTAGTKNGTYSPQRWYLYQDDNNGEFTIAAAEGYCIQSIKLNYSPQNTGTVSDSAGCNIDSSHIVVNKAVKAIDAPMVTLYVANTSDGKKGRARFEKFEVTYDVVAFYYKQKDVILGLPNIGYKNINLVNRTGEDPIFSSSDTTVALVDKNSGAITPRMGGETTITATIGERATSYTLHIEDGSYVEAFSPQGISSTKIKEIEGDMFTWHASKIYRRESDTLKTGQQGFWIQKDYYLQTSDPIEGGVKSLILHWKQFGKENKNTLRMAALFGTDSVEVINHAAESPQVDHFDTTEIKMTSNAQLKLLNTSNQANADYACRIVLGDIQFIPYLYYKVKRVEVALPVTSYDCTSADILINNAKGEVSYTIVSDETGMAAIANGILDLNDVTMDGEIVVKAQWEEVETTFTLFVTNESPTAIESVGDNSPITHHPSKIIQDGQLIILHNGERFNVCGERL